MFEFGWGFWILFFVIFFACGRMCGWGARRCGRMCGWGARKYRERELDTRETGDAGNDRLASLESRVKRLRARGREHDATLSSDLRHGQPQAREPLGARLRRKTPLQQLQESFVEGRLTLAEYERELDRLERIE